MSKEEKKIKAKDGSGDRTERDEWQTPTQLWNKLDKQYEFTFDCCAMQENTKTNRFSYYFQVISKENVKDDMCWMNPPFSKDKEMFKHFFKVVNEGVAIYRCDNMETKLWQNTILPNADWIHIPKGRINFEGLYGGGATFPSALIGLNVNPPKNIEGYTLLVYER